MALKTFIKVGAITNLTDARYCAGMGVDLLGFQVVEGASNYISPKAFQEIRGWVSGPLVVAEIYGLEELSTLNSILENYRPDYLELGLKEYALTLGKLPIPYLLTLQPDEVVPDQANPEMIIRKALPTSDTDLVHVASIQEAETALQQPVKGLALQGSSQSKPGIKEYDDLSEILEMLETD